MTRTFARLDALPSQNATQVKNKWGDVVRRVHACGMLAVTNHSSVELVMLSADAYQSLLDTVEELQARERAELDTLSDQFTARLESLQHPEAHDRLERMLASKGGARKAPIAGDTF